MTDQLMAVQAPVALAKRNLGQNPAVVYIASLNTEGGRRTMRQALDTIAYILSGGKETLQTLPWERLRFQHTQAVRTVLVQRYAPATVNKMLSALRGTLKAAWQLGLMSAEDYHLAASVQNVRAQTLPAGRAITHDELVALLESCARDGGVLGVRDAGIIAILYSTGLRRAELVALDLADYDEQAGTLRVRGKGGKERLAHVVAGARAALADWLKVRGRQPGPLFYPVGKDARLRPRRLTPQGVYYILLHRATLAGVKEIRPHDLRRTFISDLLDAGADIATVQRMAGHAQVTTTARYDRRPEEVKRAAANLLHVPYMPVGGAQVPASP